MSEPRKRVLYVAHGHPDFDKGGGEFAAYYMYESMKASDTYEVFYLARTSNHLVTHPGTFLASHDGDDRCILVYGPSADYDYFFETFQNERVNAMPRSSFREVLLTLRPEIVHFHHYVHLGVDLLSYAKRLLPGVRIFMTLHEMTAICSHSGSMLKTNGTLCYTASPQQCQMCFPGRPMGDFLLRERWFKQHLSVVEKFISPSEFLKERYRNWGLGAERIEVIDYGRPIWPRREPRRCGPDRPFVVGFFGQVVFHKGVEVLLRAALEYKRRRSAQEPRNGAFLPQIRFIVHGVMKLPPELRNVFDDMLAECDDIVSYRGPYGVDDMQTLYRAVDCLIVPSVWWENSPLTIQEAFMSGIPVICSDIGGMAEKVSSRVNGLHFRVGDPYDLLDKIMELASDQALYDRLVAGIPEIMSESEMAAHMHRLYGGQRVSGDRMGTPPSA